MSLLISPDYPHVNVDFPRAANTVAFHDHQMNGVAG